MRSAPFCQRRTESWSLKTPRSFSWRTETSSASRPAAHFTHDDPIRSVAECGAEQVPNADGQQVALGPAGLEADDVSVRQLKLRGVFHDHDSVLRWQKS